LINNAKQATFDEELRAMLPYTFQGICQIYSSQPQILIDIYDTKLNEFIRKEIQNGKPPEVDKNAKPAKKPVIYYDIMSLQKEGKDKNQPN